MDQRFCEEVVLRGEVLVDRAERHAGCLGVILHLDLVESPPPRQLQGGVDDPVPAGPLRFGQFAWKECPFAPEPTQREPACRTAEHVRRVGFLRNHISPHGMAFEQEIS